MTNRHILVMDLNDELIRSFQSKAIVVKTHDPHAVPHIMRVVSETNKLHCVQLDHKANFTTLPVCDEWMDIPIHVMGDKMGPFRQMLEKMPILRKLSIRLFFPVKDPSVYTDIQILSTLGINTGVYFTGEKADWNALSDLMYFYLYGKVPHAPIEPFKYLASEYHAQDYTDFNSVYFNNPKRYLHLNQEGKVAMTHEDLMQGNFILDHFDDLDKLEDLDAYHDYMNSWQSHFLKQEGCAFCPAWRICLGKFSDQLTDNPGCADLFSDVMDAIDFHNKRKGEFKRIELCQP